MMNGTRRSHARGIALMEVLVSLVILLFGLLGLVGVSSRANSSELEAYQRVQALQLLQDRADRVNANRKVASCYSNGATGTQFGTKYVGPPTCGTGSVQEQTRAVADMTEWDKLLKGSALTDNGKAVGMIGALGCVTQDATIPNAYIIAVSWQGLAETAKPHTADGSAEFPCGKDAYSKAGLHRVLTTKVILGALS